MIKSQFCKMTKVPTTISHCPCEFTNLLLTGSLSLTKSCYSLGRAVGWVVFSSSALLFMPVMLETERLQLQDQQKAQKNQILLGPGEQAERTSRPTDQPSTSTYHPTVTTNLPTDQISKHSWVCCRRCSERRPQPWPAPHLV